VQHWYVYYKLTMGDRAAMLERVRLVQEQIVRATSVRARLLERTEQGETTTVMEVYEDIGDADHFAAKLDAAVRAHLPADHVASRRIERFRDA
jgi:Domain of unknown function (DUF4936)